MTKLLTLKDINIKSMRVLLRVDYNCVKDGKVTDDFRIKQSLDTINQLLKSDCSIVLASHNGRPGGKYNKSLSLRPAAQVLANYIKRPVSFVDDCINDNTFLEANTMKPGEVLLLENLRFHRGEEKNSSKFAKSLAALANTYVDDAFANAHRKHASMVAITKYLPHAAGLLLQKEYETLKSLISEPKKPFMAIIGGAKISTKIDFLNELINVADIIFIGGAMANTFLRAQGYNLGSSYYEPKYVKTAKKAIELAKRKGVNLVLPTDLVVAKNIKQGAKSEMVGTDSIQKDDIALDLGRETMRNIWPLVKSAKTIFWNGTLGMAEINDFSWASRDLAEMIASRKNKALSVVGGGDTVGFIQSINMSDKYGFVSTGGGVTLELIAGKKLPAVEVLLR